MDSAGNLAAKLSNSVSYIDRVRPQNLGSIGKPARWVNKEQKLSARGTELLEAKDMEEIAVRAFERCALVARCSGGKDCWQSPDPISPQRSIERGACKVWKEALRNLKAIIERYTPVAAQRDDCRFLRRGQGPPDPFRTTSRVEGSSAPPPIGHSLGIEVETSR